ncbi:serine/threonine protein kinase [Archangium violaceum]|uniref:serine/threonine protein kinase n=1 Tax=Archangium violaceum TaxID=83451 RepID=UPI00193C26CF|nr:serine/threonine-protein kinase [Archangium violaceum]QRK05224.1 serine/threonine protein kinase [Archangium violaceum]
MQLPPFKQPESGDIVGNYRLLEKLGDGGQGLVFKAECAGRFFVLKFFRARELDEWGLTEVSLLQKFKHPNIVRVLGYGRWPDPEFGYFYIELEWVEGVTLEQYANTENPCARQCAGLILTLARTLGAVHRKNVLHRDVKRDNILIRSRNGAPVLVDFGIGNATEATTLPGFGLLPPGTPEYVSPEAWRFLGENVGEPVTYKSRVSDELWALGVTFYWLLTNRLPFGTRRNPLMVRAILSLTPKAPHECNPRVPRVLSDVCMRMLEKDLAARFPDMTALCAALESAVAAAQGDASWDVALGDPDAPEETTTDEIPAQVPWDEEELAVRRCFAPPRRGRKKPSAEESRTPVVAPPVQPAVPPSPAPVAEALAARMAAMFPAHAWEGVPLPEGEMEAPPLPAVQDSAAPGPGVVASRMGDAGPTCEAAPRRGPLRLAVSRAFPTFMGSLPVRAVTLDGLRRVALVLVLMAVAAGVSVGAVLAAFPSSRSEGTAQNQPAPEPFTSSSNNPTLHAYLARELAVSWDPPQAGRSAAIFLPPTPALEFTTAMLRKEDFSVNTPEKPQPQARRARLGVKCVTAACCAVLGGCAGSPPVRPAPKPEACPSGALDAMEKLHIRIGQEAPGHFPVVGDTKPVSVTEFSTFTIVDDLGELRPGTVLSGRLIFAEGRVFGRFTQAKQAQSKGGQTYPVCLELRSRAGELGVEMKPDGGPDSAVVSSSQDVRAVDRFE